MSSRLNKFLAGVPPKYSVSFYAWHEFLFNIASILTEFTLDESGDVTWNVPEDTEPMPFFNCETYELYSSNPHYLRFFGTFVGHVIEFQVDRPKDDTIQLTYEGWCILQCERVLNVNSKQFQSTPYSFLCALVEVTSQILPSVQTMGKRTEGSRGISEILEGFTIVVVASLIVDSFKLHCEEQIDQFH
ncbi:uncharacterized protein TNCT_259211 [Trichonephila clavata]|uniref:Uncharacterized protein n=1 Tax=Trichonephila clavata TaxID=2740835 RepID=A0A8X6F6K6_TRICU|nr:uncharacterized protein TNCT_259211 [Trichonephila clavata]